MIAITSQYNKLLSDQMPYKVALKAANELGNKDASFRKFWATPASQRKILSYGNSTANARGTYYTLITELTKPGGILEGFVTTPESPDVNEYSFGSMYIRGSNGATLKRLLNENRLEAEMAAASPNLMICRLLINDARIGTGLKECRDMVKETLDRAYNINPNVCILLCIENSLGDDEGSYQGARLIETPVFQSALNIVSQPAGEQKCLFALNGTQSVRPASIDRVGQELVCAEGTADEETVIITELTDDYFVATFKNSQKNLFTLRATSWGAAQAYSTLLRDAIIPFDGYNGQTKVIDLQARLYGFEPPYFKGYAETEQVLGDPLHPGNVGQPMEGRVLADFLTESYYRDR
jgi:hypothetical protein